MKKLFILLAFFIGLGVQVNAQVTAQGYSTATIVHPIAIEKTVDLDFGNIATDGSAGTVILSPEGNRTPSNGITLPSTSGTVTAATFTVHGHIGYTYSITLTVKKYLTSCQSRIPMLQF